MADASLLKQLLENLFRNAIEHADGVETITAGITDRGFYVADDGHGIAPEERGRVFDTGYSTNKADGNTGMGLAIVQKIADAHDWSVRLVDASDRSDSDRPGTRFEFDGVTLG